MTIIIDKRPVNGWRHMSGYPIGKLHEFAIKIGLKTEWFQNKEGYPHYDLKEGRAPLIKALKIGVEQVDRKRFIECCRTWYSKQNW